MTPRGIITAGYRAGLVPKHLHGKTQHKTLGARVSEDILKRRDQSAFFRTEPGKFFVREYLADETISESFRVPFQARRRVRDLVQGPVLYAKHQKETSATCSSALYSSLDEMEHRYSFKYSERNILPKDFMQVWSFVCVVRGNHILTYRLGRYRDDRDSFVFKRSVGFKAAVSLQDTNLFNQETLGIIDAGIFGAMTDLDMPSNLPNGRVPAEFARIHSLVHADDGGGCPVLLAVVLMKCPDWFEPLKRRLALNDLCWLNLTHRANDIDDFDPWSKSVLENGFYSAEWCDVEDNKTYRR